MKIVFDKQDKPTIETIFYLFCFGVVISAFCILFLTHLNLLPDDIGEAMKEYESAKVLFIFYVLTISLINGVLMFIAVYCGFKIIYSTQHTHNFVKSEVCSCGARYDD